MSSWSTLLISPTCSASTVPVTTIPTVTRFRFLCLAVCQAGKLDPQRIDSLVKVLGPLEMAATTPLGDPYRID